MKNIFVLLFSVISLAASAQTSLWPLQDESSGKYGFVGARGNWVIQPEFDEVMEIYFNSDNVPRDYATVKRNEKWGCVNRKGETVVRFVFVNARDAFWAGNEWQKKAPLGKTLYLIQNEATGEYGFVNYIGNWAIRPKFEDCMEIYFSSDNIDRAYATVKHNGKWGCINKKGDFVVAPVFAKSADAFWAGNDWQKSSDYVAVAPSQVPNLQDTSFGSKPKLDDGLGATGSILVDYRAKEIVSSPTLKILSPKDGSDYNSGEVVISYEAKSVDGSTPEILVSINGAPYDMKTKGVKRASNELALKLPQKKEGCIVQLIAKDSKGYSEPVLLAFRYTGDKQKPTLRMLSVGVGRYADANISKLEHAAKDAIDMANVVKSMHSKEYYKIEPPILLTDADATALKFKSALMKLVGSAEQDDVVFIYFSGHGAKENNEAYFLLSDAAADDLYSTAVNFSDIRRAMRMLVDKHCKVVAFIDACHAGALYNTKSISETLQFAQPGVIGFYSSTSFQKSNEAEKWQNGIFTKALVDGLKGRAKDKNGNITTLELAKYIKETVYEETNKMQSPIVENEVGEFVLF